MSETNPAEMKIIGVQNDYDLEGNELVYYLRDALNKIGISTYWQDGDGTHFAYLAICFEDYKKAEKLISSFVRIHKSLNRAKSSKKYFHSNYKEEKGNG